MIEELKDNERAYCFLSQEEQEFLEAHKDDLLLLHISGEWRDVSDPSFFDPTIYRLRPSFEYNEKDFELTKKRWFFDATDFSVLSHRGGSVFQHSYNGHESSSLKDSLCDLEEFLIEVSESDLPYLEKPGGDWEFRKPERGDKYHMPLKTIDGLLQAGVMEHSINAVLPADEGVLQGYRWCKVPSQVENSAQKTENARWVEYPIKPCKGIYYCEMENINYSLDELPAIVGFGGIKWVNPFVPETFAWSVSSPAHICDKPWVPVMAKFWVEA